MTFGVVAIISPSWKSEKLSLCGRTAIGCNGLAFIAIWLFPMKWQFATKFSPSKATKVAPGISVK